MFMNLVCFVLGVVFAVPVTAWWKNKSAAAAAEAAAIASRGVSSIVNDVKKSSF